MRWYETHHPFDTGRCVKMHTFIILRTKPRLSQAGALLLEGVSKCTPSLFYVQSPDFHKLGLCYYLKILYL